MANLSPPWNIYFSKVKVLFEQDPDIKGINFDQESKVITLVVSNPEKAGAIEQLLPATKEFGNVTVTIKVEVFVEDAEESKSDILSKAFCGNPIFKGIEKNQTLGCAFCIFKKEVVQFYTDDLTTPDGYYSTLYEEVAREVFGSDEDSNEVVYYSTSRE